MTTKPDPEEMQERLDELGDHIEEARHQAEQHGTIPDPHPHHHATFIDPDGDGEVDDGAGAIGG